MRLSYEGGKAVAEVHSLPGCSQVAVVHAANVLPAHRSGGIGTAAHMDRLARLRDELAYDFAVCTVDKANAAQLSIVRKAGWTQVGEFTSRRTGNTVTMWVRNLTEEG
jgi:L-amino acid N-acyltransferase YncA